MSARSQSLHQTLRPTQPIAVGFMLGQICTGTLAIAFAALVTSYIDGFTLALLIVSGMGLITIGVRDAERDRTLLPRDAWPSFKSRAIVWLSVILFTASPLVFIALLVDRFAGGTFVTGAAVTVSCAGWGVTSYRKLRFDQLWLPRPADEEVEAGLAVGALLLSAVLVSGWLLVRTDLAFGYGPLPSGVGAAGGVALSLLATIVAAGACLVPLLVWQVAKSRSTLTLHVALGVLYVPICLLLLLPMARWGHPTPWIVPVYTAEMAGRVLLAAVLAFGVVEYLRKRR